MKSPNHRGFAASFLKAKLSILCIVATSDIAITLHDEAFVDTSKLNAHCHTKVAGYRYIARG